MAATDPIPDIEAARLPPLPPRFMVECAWAQALRHLDLGEIARLKDVVDLRERCPGVGFRESCSTE